LRIANWVRHDLLADAIRNSKFAIKLIYLFYKVRKQDIHYIKSIIEGYENLMVVSTVDEDLPKIQVTLAPDFYDDCVEILKDLQKRFLMIQLDEPKDVSQGNY